MRFIAFNIVVIGALVLLYNNAAGPFDPGGARAGDTGEEIDYADAETSVETAEPTSLVSAKLGRLQERVRDLELATAALMALKDEIALTGPVEDVAVVTGHSLPADDSNGIEVPESSADPLLAEWRQGDMESPAFEEPYRGDVPKDEDRLSVEGEMMSPRERRGALLGLAQEMELRFLASAEE